MLHFKVKEILQASGYKTPALWLVKHCGLTKAKAYKILNDKQQSINLRDFSKLCENLNCTPNDLMYWEQTARTKVPDSHAVITQLSAPEKNSDWFQLFKHLPPDKILALHKEAVKLTEKKV